MRTRATDDETIVYLLKKHKVGEREAADIHAAILDEASESLRIVVDWLNVSERELRDARWAASPGGQDYLNGAPDADLIAEQAAHDRARTARRHPDQLWYYHPVAVLPGEKLT